MIAIGAVDATATARAAIGAGGERAPRILGFEYYEDYEGIGNRYNVAATVKGVARRVTARSGSLRTEGELSRRISPTGPGKVWFFRDRDFVSQLRGDLEADGQVTVFVRALGDAGNSRKQCTLVLERDPQFGDHAGGKCRKLAA